MFVSWGSSQYLPLTAILRSLALISPQDSAGISGTKPNKPEEKKQENASRSMTITFLIHYRAIYNQALFSTKKSKLWSYQIA